MSTQALIELGTPYVGIGRGRRARVQCSDRRATSCGNGPGSATSRIGSRTSKAGWRRCAPTTSARLSLTTAELRLLPLLQTHLTFPEIGARLHVSRHTVKTQAISIYQKLDVSSRSEAIERMREIGLLDT